MVAPFPYIGGKYFLATRILPCIPPHRIYCEPFFGSGQIFFRKEPARVEVVNDLDGELITFFRVCQHHSEELLRCMQFSVISRRHYDDLVVTPPSGLTDIQRACRFLYLQKLGYGGLVKGNHYVHKTRKPLGLRAHTLPTIIRSIHDRLNGVQIECLDYQKILTKFDHPDTFFYLDSPYYGLEFYKFNFAQTDFTILAKLLSRLRGRFLLSLNDLPEIRKIFSSFYIEQAFNHCGSKSRQTRRVPELLISNYKQPDRKQ